ncbi:MAG: YdhR family protein [Parvularculaceae bacterium]
MIICIVRFETKLSYDEVLEVAKARVPDFKALKGLIQKYYVQYAEPNTFGGIYIWDSKESLAQYRASDLAASIGEAYQATSAPKVEIAEGLFPLRD